MNPFPYTRQPPLPAVQLKVALLGKMKISHVVMACCAQIHCVEPSSPPHLQGGGNRVGGQIRYDWLCVVMRFPPLPPPLSPAGHELSLAAAPLRVRGHDGVSGALGGTEGRPASRVRLGGTHVLGGTH